MLSFSGHLRTPGTDVPGSVVFCAVFRFLKLGNA